MASTTNILGIAPYEKLNNTIQIVSKDSKEFETEIFTADLEEGQRLTNELIKLRCNHFSWWYS